MKKSVKLFTIVSLIISVLFVSVGAFSDVDANTEEGKAILKMQSHGYIQGVGNNMFLPNKTLTRAEFATIINKMYEYTVDTENIFTDVSADDWFYKDILAAVQAGYIKGMGDGTFMPNKEVTREEVCVMLNRILKAELLPINNKIQDQISDWARESVEILVSNRLFILEEGGKFRGTEAITRSEVCVALEKCIIDEQIEIEPIDMEGMAREELEKKLNSMIKIMEEKVIPECTYEKSKIVASRVTESMKKYLEDKNYDYVSYAKETYEIYRKSGEASKELKTLIAKYVNASDMTILFEFFYTPEISNIN